MDTHYSGNKDSNKIYFLVAIILTLLGTNAYLFFKDKKSNERIITISDEKNRMQIDIDKIEAELDKTNSANIKLTEEMQNEQEMARQKIATLREALKNEELTQSQLAKARKDIKSLRFFISEYAADIESLKRQNANLLVERDSLKSNVSSMSAKASNLERQNEELNNKVKTAAALRAGAITLRALRIRTNGKETEVNKASTAEKIRAAFTLAENTIAEKRVYNIFIRVIDPNGNLITTSNTGMFVSEGDDLQYSYKTAIEFSNDGKVYTIDWANPKAFQKGVYTVVLYSDGYPIGTSALNLK